MKSLYLAAGLVLATATSASAETFPNPTLATGLSTVSAEAQANLDTCFGDESSSRAIRACTKSLRDVAPNAELRAKLYTHRALHRMALEDFDHAAADFSRAGSLMGDDGLETLGHGFTAMMQKDLTTAKAKFEDCSNQGKIAPLAQYGLGLTLQMAGETQEAQDAYRKALQLRPGWDAVVEQMATLQER